MGSKKIMVQVLVSEAVNVYNEKVTKGSGADDLISSINGRFKNYKARYSLLDWRSPCESQLSVGVKATEAFMGAVKLMEMAEKSPVILILLHPNEAEEYMDNVKSHNRRVMDKFMHGTVYRYIFLNENSDAGVESEFMKKLELAVNGCAIEWSAREVFKRFAEA